MYFALCCSVTLMMIFTPVFVVAEHITIPLNLPRRNLSATTVAFHLCSHSLSDLITSRNYGEALSRQSAIQPESLFLLQHDVYGSHEFPCSRNYCHLFTFPLFEIRVESGFL